MQLRCLCWMRQIAYWIWGSRPSWMPSCSAFPGSGGQVRCRVALCAPSSWPESWSCSYLKAWPYYPSSKAPLFSLPCMKPDPLQVCSVQHRQKQWRRWRAPACATRVSLAALQGVFKGCACWWFCGLQCATSCSQSLPPPCNCDCTTMLT